MPSYIKCPNCKEPISTKRICNLCNAKVQALINTHPEIFQENVFDRLNPRLEEILFEIKLLNKALTSFKIRGLKLKAVHSLTEKF